MGHPEAPRSQKRRSSGNSLGNWYSEEYGYHRLGSDGGAALAGTNAPSSVAQVGDSGWRRIIFRSVSRDPATQIWSGNNFRSSANICPERGHFRQ